MSWILLIWGQKEKTIFWQSNWLFFQKKVLKIVKKIVEHFLEFLHIFTRQPWIRSSEWKHLEVHYNEKSRFSDPGIEVEANLFNCV